MTTHDDARTELLFEVASTVIKRCSSARARNDLALRELRRRGLECLACLRVLLRARAGGDARLLGASFCCSYPTRMEEQRLGLAHVLQAAGLMIPFDRVTMLSRDPIPELRRRFNQ
jgi:hypothetical protein